MCIDIFSIKLLVIFLIQTIHLERFRSHPNSSSYSRLILHKICFLRRRRGPFLRRPQLTMRRSQLWPVPISAPLARGSFGFWQVFNRLSNDKNNLLIHDSTRKLIMSGIRTGMITRLPSVRRRRRRRFDALSAVFYTEDVLGRGRHVIDIFDV